MRLLTRRWQRAWHSRPERGQALAEFAIVALVFFLFVFGIFDMARLFQSWNTVQHAAREGARYAITNNVDCEGANDREACVRWTARTATTGLTGGGPDASSDIVRVQYTSLSAKSDYTQPSTVHPLGEQCDIVEVTVEYTHHFATPMMQVLGGISLKGTQRMMNEPWGPCPDGAAYAGGGGGNGPGGDGQPPQSPGDTPGPEPTATSVPPTATPSDAPTWSTPGYHGTQGSSWTYEGVHYPYYYGWSSEGEVPLPPPSGCVYIGVPDDPDWNAHEIWCLDDQSWRF